MDAVLSPRRRRLLGALGSFGSLAALGGAPLVAGCGDRGGPAPPGSLHLHGETMGSTFNVRIAGAPSADGFARVARDAVTAAFDEVVRRMSTFDATSELRRFGAHAATTPFGLSAQTLAVLRRAQQVSQASGGAFDVTVAPLVGAWGFGAGAASRGAVPTPAMLATLAPRVGWQRLVVDEAAGTARKAHPDLLLDLSGIAKGHAVDRAAAALQALGVTRFMVEAGGEVRTQGLNAQRRPWQIAIEKPDAWPPRVQCVVPLEGLAMATSGDYRNFYEVDGRRLSHGIDPAKRAPVAHALASVSVVHDECISADAWATALFVLGPERGLALAQQQALAAHFVVREEGGRLREFVTRDFARLAAA